MGRTTADRTVAVLAAAALALGLAACSDAGPEEPSSQPTLTTATPTDEPSQAIEPRDPLPLTATDAFEERYRCFTELADARWLAGESEGLDVGAALVGSGDRLVVSHQADKDACSVMFLARRLVDDGYLVAVPVHRAATPSHSSSESSPTRGPTAPSTSCSAAARWAGSSRSLPQPSCSLLPTASSPSRLPTTSTHRVRHPASRRCRRPRR